MLLIGTDLERMGTLRGCLVPDHSTRFSSAGCRRGLIADLEDAEHETRRLMASRYAPEIQLVNRALELYLQGFQWLAGWGTAANSLTPEPPLGESLRNTTLR
jgi:hypothetical protein